MDQASQHSQKTKLRPNAARLADFGATGPYGAFGFTHDGVGNRLSHSFDAGGGAQVDSYAYPAGSNRLAAVALAAGGTRSLGYDAAGRLASVTVGGVVQAEYKYNALGQQAVRSFPGSGLSIHSVYGPDGNRIAEFDGGTGALIREYVWFEGAPIAVIEGGVVYFVRSDHIGRPVFATTQAGTVVWTATHARSSERPLPALLCCPTNASRPMCGSVCQRPLAVQDMFFCRRPHVASNAARARSDKPGCARRRALNPAQLQIEAPFRIRRRGVETKVMLGDRPAEVDKVLIRNLLKARDWFAALTRGESYSEIAERDGVWKQRIQQMLPLAFLAPDIVQLIAEGRQPVGLTTEGLINSDLPVDWAAQRALIARL